MVKFFYLREPSKNTLELKVFETLMRFVSNGQLNGDILVQELKLNRENSLNIRVLKALKRLVSNGQLRGDALVPVLKRSRGNPIACVAYERPENGKVKFALSVVYSGQKDLFGWLKQPDTFVKERARKITEARLRSKPVEVSLDANNYTSLHVMDRILEKISKDSKAPQRARKAAKYMLELSDAVAIAKGGK